VLNGYHRLVMDRHEQSPVRPRRPGGIGPSWPEWPSLQSGPKRACLYASVAPDGDILVAQTTYTVPAAPSDQPAPSVDYDCSDFTYQEDAQA
jgi:hypothetical protein